MSDPKSLEESRYHLTSPSRFDIVPIWLYHLDHRILRVCKDSDIMHSLECSLLHDFFQGLLAVHLQRRVVLLRCHLRLAHRRETVRVSHPLAVLYGFDPIGFIFLQWI